jgi:WD40 repeat protein
MLFATIIAVAVARGDEVPKPASDANDPARGAQATSRTPFTNAERDRAWPLADEGAARWKVRIRARGPSDVAARDSVFAMAGGTIFTPFESCLVGRGLNDGWLLLPMPTQRFDSVVVQVEWSRHGLALVLASRPDATGHDVSYLATLGVPSVTIDTGGDPWRIMSGPFGEFAICQCDGTIKLVDKDRARSIAVFDGERPDHGAADHDRPAAFSPWGHWLATTHSNVVSFRLPSNGHVESEWRPALGDKQRVTAISFNTNGDELLAFLRDDRDDGRKRARFLRFNIDDRLEQVFEGSHAANWGFALPDDATFVTFNGSPTISVWQITKREDEEAFEAAPKHVYDSQLAPSGDTIATVGDDGVVKFWDTATWKQRETKISYTHDGANVIKFSPEGSYLATLSDDGWLRVWDSPDFCRAHRPPQLLRTDLTKFPIALENYANGMKRERHPDGTVKETLPNGTIKTYKQQ